MKQNKQYLQIDLLHIMRALREKFWIVGLSAGVCGLFALLISSFLIRPSYEANAMLYVNNNSSANAQSTKIDASDLNAAQSLVDTYIVILYTKETINEVISQAGVDYTYDELIQMIDAGSVNATEVFEIQVTSHDAEEAAHIANTIVEILPTRISDVVEGSSVQIADHAVVPEKQSFPNVLLFTIVGIILGLLGSCFGVILFELINDEIREGEDLNQTYGFPVLALIPDLQDHHTYSDYSNRNAKV